MDELTKKTILKELYYLQMKVSFYSEQIEGILKRLKEDTSEIESNISELLKETEKNEQK